VQKDLDVETDFYYACLEGAWDADGDGVLGNDEGEAEYSLECRHDSLGGYVCDRVVPVQASLEQWPDVYIGRFPVSDGIEAKTLVDKTVAYAYGPHRNTYGSAVAFLAAFTGAVKLVSGCRFSAARGGQDYIDVVEHLFHYELKPLLQAAPSPFGECVFDEYYEDSLFANGDMVAGRVERSAAEWVEYLSRGYTMVFISGHGSPRTIMMNYWTGTDFRIEDAEQVHGGSFSHVLTHSCRLMKRENDTCIAKSFLVNPHGGAVTFFGSSELDYAKHTREQMRYAADLMVNRKEYRVLRALQLAGVGIADPHYAPIEYFPAKTVWWSEDPEYSAYARHNLLIKQYWGDPEIEVWTRPISASDTFAILAERVGARMRVTVEPPLDSVLICAYEPGAVFMRGYTRSGTIELDTLPAQAGHATITATKHDWIPSRTTVDANLVMPRRQLAAQDGSEHLTILCKHPGIITVQSSGAAAIGDALVCDLAGRVMKRSGGASSTTMDLRSVSSGTYVLRVTVGARRCVRPFVLR